MDNVHRAGSYTVDKEEDEKMKELCKICHKKQADAIVIDSNPLSLAMYLEAKERWDKEGICIKCQEMEK